MAKLTTAQYEEAKELFRSGEMKIAEIATRFGVVRKTLERRFNRDGVKVDPKRAEEVGAAVKDAVKNAAIETVKKEMALVNETKDSHYRYAKNLTLIAMNLITQAVKDKKPLAMVEGDLKSLKLAMDISKVGKDIRYSILNIDVEDQSAADLVELPLKEISDEEARDMASQKNDGLDFDDDDVGLSEEETKSDD